jgi:hypothetical protein
MEGCVSVFDNDEGFQVRVEKVRQENPPRNPADPQDDPVPYPAAYRSLIIWLTRQAEVPEAAPVVLQGARDLMDRVLDDIQTLHSNDIEYVVRGRERWWGSDPDRPCANMTEKFDVLRRAGFVIRAFSDRAAHFDALTPTPQNVKNYVTFLREFIIILFVTPTRIP